MISFKKVQRKTVLAIANSLGNISPYLSTDSHINNVFWIYYLYTFELGF